MIKLHMWECCEKKKPLPYVLLIMAFLKNEDVNWRVGQLTRAAVKWRIDANTFLEYKSTRPTRKSKSGVNQTILDALARMSRKIERLSTKVDKVNKKVNTLLAQEGIEISDEEPSEDETEEEEENEGSDQNEDEENDD